MNSSVHSFQASLEYTQSYFAKRFGKGLFTLAEPTAPRIRLDDCGKSVVLPPFLGGLGVDSLLEGGLELRMLPADAFVKETLGEVNIPALCQRGTPSPSRLVTVEEDTVLLHFDLLGSAFYILTRTEEFLSPVRDTHDRFPATASHALAHGYLHRPVVDEYVEILRRCIQHLWPGVERKQDSFRTMVTHDVDVPFEYLFRPGWKAARIFGGDILRRHSPHLAFNRAARWFDVKHLGGWQRDPLYTFETIMDISESHGLKSAFYFLIGRNSPMDGEYNLTHPRIAALMRRIHDRGHEIGYHGSYTTYRDADTTRLEVSVLKEAASTLGIEQTTWGGRQHYLRWNAPVTWRNYAEAGLHYDTTLSYADHAGFRCGTCHPFPVFDVEHNTALNLVEHPLIVMECSVLDDRYMNLPHGEAQEYILKLKRTCRKFGGCFGLLWHNSRFVEPAEVELYKSALEG